MKTAYVNLRYTNDERAALFHEGLRRLGYKVSLKVPLGPKNHDDIFVTWNRIGKAADIASRFTKSGCTVLVAENATWGNTFAGENWYHIARTYHNTADTFDYEGPERFDSLGVGLKPFKDPDGSVIILLQRGIGSPPVRAPLRFKLDAIKDYPGAYLRKHPGNYKPARPLSEDLERYTKAVTWGSGAAIAASIEGLEVVSYMPKWIGAHEPTELSRLVMLRRLAWAQWRYSEIESGEAFKRLIA
jgi:hypothetical protein